MTIRSVMMAGASCRRTVVAPDWQAKQVQSHDSLWLKCLQNISRDTLQTYVARSRPRVPPAQASNKEQPWLSRAGKPKSTMPPFPHAQPSRKTLTISSGTKTPHPGPFAGRRRRVGACRSDTDLCWPVAKSCGREQAMRGHSSPCGYRAPLNRMAKWPGGGVYCEEIGWLGEWVRRWTVHETDMSSYRQVIFWLYEFYYSQDPGASRAQVSALLSYQTFPLDVCHYSLPYKFTSKVKWEFNPQEACPPPVTLTSQARDEPEMDVLHWQGSP